MAKQVSTETLRNFAKDSKVSVVKVLKFGEGENQIEFELKQYASIDDKRVIVEIVTSRAFIEDEIKGLKYLDKTLEEVISSYYIIKYYTNINVTEDLFELYDLVVSTGLIEFIKENIPFGELEKLSEMIDIRIEEEYRLQEIENGTGYQLESMMDMLIRKVTESLDTIKGFDTGDLNVFGEGTKIEDVLKANKDDVVIKDNELKEQDFKVVKEDSNNDIGDSED